MIYAAITDRRRPAFWRLPAGFLPVDDQGFITTDVLTPPDASFPRTLEAVKRVEDYLVKHPAVDTLTFLRVQFSRSGAEHGAGLHYAQGLVTTRRGKIGRTDRGGYQSPLAPLRDGKISALQPPPIDNLGNSSGFSFRLQDRGQRGYAALMRASDQLLAAAAAECPVLKDVYVEGLSPAPQIELIVDREKAAALGVTFEEINNTISTNLGSNYVNDFPNRGRMQRVVVQADRGARMQADEILTYNVRNARGQLVPVSSFATARWSVGPSQIVGFNYYPSVRISGSAKPGYTSGDAIGEMERLAAQLPRGFGYDWTGQSLQEKLSGSQAPFLLMLSALLAFLVLAALYESWTIPLAVLLTVPLGILGAVAAATLRGLPNDVYFTVSIVTIIGLAAKDGILIIEFAKALREQGQPIRAATIAACRMRFRPIVMTGLAFVFGVAPMIVASGAGAKSQQALGTSVMGGMTAVVALALLMVPVFFVSVQAAFSRQARQELRAAATAEAQSAPQQAYASPGPSLARR